MTKRIIFTTAFILSVAASFAQNHEGTKVITNPDTVKITNTKERLSVEIKKGDKDYKYKRYRCPNFRLHKRCDFNKSLSENVLERKLLADIEQFMEEAKIKSAQVADANTEQIKQYDIEEIYERIDRLNYSWNTGKIRTVEKYEADYEELMQLLEKAQNERNNMPVKDFSKIEAILHEGWRAIYDNLDDAYKRAFWRSFIQSIELEWTTAKKEIKKVNFFE